MNIKSYPHPLNVFEAISILEQTLDSAQREFIMETSEDEFVAKSHHGVGRFLRNLWLLWTPAGTTPSPLAEYFHGIGVYHADDMSSIILHSLWRDVHGKPLELDDQVKNIRDYWSRMIQVSERTKASQQDEYLITIGRPDEPNKNGDSVRMHSLKIRNGPVKFSHIFEPPITAADFQQEQRTPTKQRNSVLGWFASFFGK